RPGLGELAALPHAVVFCHLDEALALARILSRATVTRAGACTGAFAAIDAEALHLVALGGASGRARVERADGQQTSDRCHQHPVRGSRSHVSSFGWLRAAPRPQAVVLDRFD